MDCKEVGGLIRSLRREKSLTQRELALKLNISDKAVSKWERGAGFPDVNVLAELSDTLGVDITSIINGQLKEGNALSGNMKKSKIYYCPNCNNVIIALGEAEVVCCGRRLKRLEAKPADEEHRCVIEAVEDELFVSLNHEMSKRHYITASFMLTDDKLQEVKLYPEGNAEARYKKQGFGILYTLCVRDGLFYQNIK